MCFSPSVCYETFVKKDLCDCELWQIVGISITVFLPKSCEACVETRANKSMLEMHLRVWNEFH